MQSCLISRSNSFDTRRDRQLIANTVFDFPKNGLERSVDLPIFDKKCEKSVIDQIFLLHDIELDRQYNTLDQDQNWKQSFVELLNFQKKPLANKIRDFGIIKTTVIAFLMLFGVFGVILLAFYASGKIPIIKEKDVRFSQNSNSVYETPIIGWSGPVPGIKSLKPMALDHLPDKFWLNLGEIENLGPPIASGHFGDVFLAEIRNQKVACKKLKHPNLNQFIHEVLVDIIAFHVLCRF